MGVAIVCSCVIKVCRNGALKSQGLELLGVLMVCLRSGTEICLSKMENCRSQGRLGCDEGGNCVQLVAQSVPQWGPEITDSRTAWLAEGMFATLY